MERLVHHLEDLHAFRDRVRGTIHEHTLYMPQIASERARLLAHIHQLGGQAAVDKVSEWGLHAPRATLG